MASWRCRVWALVMATVLTTPAGALARVAHICSMTGQRTFTCCCATAKSRAKEMARQLAGQVRIQIDDCCEPLDSQESTTGALPLPVAPLAALMPECLTVTDMTSGWQAPEPTRWWRSRGPPGTGPPLFIKYCSLLN